MLKTRKGFTASNAEHASYSVFFLGQNVMWALVGLIATFMTDIGFSAALAAAILIVPKVWDAVNDTLFGFIVDRVKPKNGQKFMPWVRLGVALVGVSTLLMFAIPANLPSQTLKIVWFVVAYLLFDAAYTMLDAPMFAMSTVMTQNIQERTSIISGCKLWSMVGAMATIVLLPMFRPQIGWFASAIIVVVISVVCMIPALFICKERHSVLQQKEEQVKFKQMIHYLGKNKYLLFVLIAMIIIGITSIERTLCIQLARICFGSERFSAILNICVSLPIILISAIIPTLAKKWDKFRVLICGLSASVVFGVIDFFVGYQNTVVAIIFTALKCAGLAFYTVICYMLVADTVEYGTYKSGTRAAGITFSMQTFVAKLNGAIVGSVVLLLLAAVGFVEGEGAVQPETVAPGIWAIFTLFPACGYTLAIVFLVCFYKLRDKAVQTMAEYNNGTITREEAIAILGEKYGEPAPVTESKE